MEKDLFSEHDSGIPRQSSIPVIKKGTVKLTAAQSEFNRLNKKIMKLKNELSQLPKKRCKVEAFYLEHVLPLMHTYNQLAYQRILDLEMRYENDASEEIRFDLSGVILRLCMDLLQNTKGLEEDACKVLNGLLRKHELKQSGLTEGKFEKQKVKDILNMFTMIVGIKPTAKMKKAKTEEEAMSLIVDYFEKEASSEEWDRSFFDQEEEPAPKRKMTQAAMKRKMQEEQTKKSIRTLYMELAKTLHPDLEQDEGLRAIKEERMKQLTEAYRKNDLASILSMQLQWLEESMGTNLSKQPDMILKGYNKVLREQLKKLEEELSQAIYMIPDLPIELLEVLCVPDNVLELHLEAFRKSEQQTLDEFKRKCKASKSKRGLNKLLKEYRQDNEMDDFLWDMLLGE